jgi:hypothetical protein
MSNEQIHDLLWSDPTTFVANTLNQSDTKYKDDYIGIVVDNKERGSDHLGRCKIRVFGLFDEVNEKDLPWAMPDFNFVGSLVGSFIVPPIGCIVKVYFENGDVYFPKYTRKVVDSSKLPTNRGTDYPNNMIFFETDNGSSFEINRLTDETKFIHKSGLTEITVDTTGTVKIKTHKIVDENALLAIPGIGSGGHYCAIQNCLYTGMTHVSNQAGI